jgi:hypothetical protein
VITGRRSLAVAAGAIASLAAVPALAAAPQTPPGNARLVGNFLLAGRITVADNIPGERRGQTFLRTWSFASSCAVGACATVVLVRPRANGIDTVPLRRRRPGYYTGAGQFYAPLKCGKRTYARGALVPFTITVTVTAASANVTTVTATRVDASYTNPTRMNLTPCFAVLGHDAARYHGHLVIGAAPPG